uniref:DmpA family aminopeptidase n=1 Tax=uncultured Sphingomonas sp. TaxID=158754 RepID=UPI0025F1544C|nr:P1 family peptidase [uncultured Sphingomonas sp.]
MNRLFAFAALLLIGAAPPHSTRARDLGVPFEGTPGPLNAITDVAGVEVGHTTLISGSGPRVRGKGPVRTGVTAVLPRGRQSTSPVFAGWFTLNAAGEMTGTTWLEERGLLDGPVMITNTHSVGVVRDAAVRWMVDRGWESDWHVPVTAETWDGALNDLNGFHVRQGHALAALQSARSGPVAEGSVGGGTGMMCNDFKGGIGTSSRRLAGDRGGYTVGVLVQCNYGYFARRTLRIAGAPVGRDLASTHLPCFVRPVDSPVMPYQTCGTAAASGASGDERERDGSIIVVIATDAPLLPHQLRRIAKRPSLGLGRLGSIAANGSGDIFIAFSTANPDLRSVGGESSPPVAMLANDRLSPLFEAVTQATEEAVVNAMVAAKTMEGADGLRVYGLPHEKLRQILAKYNRLDAAGASSAR